MLQYMETLGNNLVAKNGIIPIDKYYCELCDYKCSKKYNWNKHLLTSKHHVEASGSNLETESGKIEQNNCCEICNKEFKTRSGLWKHNKTCNIAPTICADNKEQNDKDLIMMIINDNKELRNLLIEQCKEKDELKTMMLEVLKNGTTQNSNNTTTTTNSHNKAFNLQFFLNETCKDAMNITDFVDSIKLQMSDLLSVGELGYVKGISKIITASLKALDVSKRPVHCADQKREVVYIKDDDKWEREGEDKQKLKKAIRRVASKNQRLLPEFKAAYPDCMKSNSRYSDHYCKLIMEAMGGRGDNDAEKEAKIIRNITVASTIEK